MSVETKEYPEQNAVVFKPTEELLTAEVIRQIQALAGSQSRKHVVLDFSAIRFLVSASLFPDAEPFTPLLRLNENLKQEARRLTLCCLAKEIADVFRIIRFDQVFEIQSDSESGLTKVGSQSQ